MLFMRAEVSDDSSTFVANGRMCPCSRMIGGLPTVRCRSLALWETTVWSSLSMSSVPIAVAFLPRGPRASDLCPKTRDPWPAGRGLTSSYKPGVHRYEVGHTGFTARRLWPVRQTHYCRWGPAHQAAGADVT